MGRSFHVLIRTALSLFFTRREVRRTPARTRASPPTAAPTPIPTLAPVESGSGVEVLLVPAMMYVGWGAADWDGTREGGGGPESRVKAVNEGGIVGTLSSISVALMAL